jgi:penicillin amidase
MLAERAEPLIATAWMRELARGVYADEFGPELFKAYFDQRHVFLRNVLADAGGQGRWCDDAGTPAREGCDAVVAAALTRALADLAARYGKDPAAWRWGEAHAARSTHRPFSRVAPLAKWFDVRVPTPGDTYTVNVGRHTIRDEDEPFVNRHAASLRALYDLADLENSRWMHSTGQSGIVFSPWYRSYAERWAQVRYMPMRMDAPAGAGTLRLLPR